MSLAPDLGLVELGLDALEELEVRSLVWGLVDLALSTEEVDEALQHVLASDRGKELKRHPDCTVVTAADLRERLTRIDALFPALDATGLQVGWRTRMAEGVRLFAQLRQMFDQHAGDRWSAAPSLVADYRLLRRARRYPRRDVSPQDTTSDLSQVVQDPWFLQAIGQWLSGMPAGAALARFQVDATARIARSLEEKSRTATLVSAGTGSGKTIAFYLPALAWLASRRMVEPHARGVRVLALYPRNELLKDQLAEVYAQCRRFDNWIGRHGGAPLRVGVLYGETPKQLRSGSHTPSWARNARYRYSVCPFFRCPACGGDLAALDQDLDAKVHRLVCQGCQQAIDRDTFAYTREDIAADPPDILFTSVEMLNRHMSTVDMRHVFGIGPRAQRAPDLVLMDEVHLYTGSYGAQVAYLMRRWWSATRRRSSFVGLSATLANGRLFFASLTGLAESVVEEIRPTDDDMILEGAEYLLALRGDPVSQSALLSTSIQALMLGSRLLDPRSKFNRSTRPFFGWRAFAFTDQLDAVNRLYRDLLDAEGRYPNSGEPNPRKRALAALRAPSEPPGRRYTRGQDWRTPRDIGHAPEGKQGVSRTTSYHTGVSTQSQIVVATAALEVGFDDEAVGLVLQHKAPRDMASFLQRKGRAGRTRHTRPWTVVVLSDYGRDPLAYRAYEQLFDPELPPRTLPLSNRYVQRMQAVYALLDDVGDRLEGAHPPVNVWRSLRSPSEFPTSGGWTDRDLPSFRTLFMSALPASEAEVRSLKKRAHSMAPTQAENKWAGANWLVSRIEQRHVLNVLTEYLADESQVRGLTRKLGDRLAVAEEDIQPLMWEQPRPVVLGAIPTAQRRLSTNWRTGDGDASDYVAGHPLPEFVPANLFDDLSLPEMRLDVPVRGGRDVQHEYMPVQQALGEFAVGKVSRRFTDAHWLGFDEAELAAAWSHPQGEVLQLRKELGSLYSLDRQSPFTDAGPNQPMTVQAFRPVVARLSELKVVQGLDVGDTSTAQVIWRSHLLTKEAGDVLLPPAKVGISALIHEVHAHTHARQNAAVVRRYARGTRAELRLSRGTQSKRASVECAFVVDGQPAGVGFDIDTDAVVLVLQLPEGLHRAIDWTPERLRAARAARYNHEIQHGPDLSAIVPNPFLRSWIGQIFLIAGVLRVHSSGHLRQALDELSAGQHRSVLLGVLTSVFQATDDEFTADRLRQSLTESLTDSRVLQAVRRAARVLVDPIDAEWDGWLSLIIRTTLGAACLQGIQEALPELDADSLVVDIDPGWREPSDVPRRPELWISEINPGGNGLIEQIVEMLVTRPELLFKHIEAALGPQDLEFTAIQMRSLASWLGSATGNSDIQQAVDQVRTAESAVAARQSFGELRAQLTRHGQSVFHGYAVSLSMRFLRPGSPRSLDRLIEDVCVRWDELESRLGVEIDLRVVCALYSDDSRVDQAVIEAGHTPPQHNLEHWRVGVLTGLLWARGHALRAVALPLYNRFAPATVATERLLLTQWLTPRATPIDPTTSDWLDQAHAALRARQSVTVSAAASDARRWLPTVMQAFVAEPVQFDYLNVYARLSEVRRRGDQVDWTFSIPEAQ